MKKFLIITNPYKDVGLAMTNSMVAYIKEHGGDVKCLVNSLSKAERDQFDVNLIEPDTECIFVLGGDGTLIRVATAVEQLQIPLVGVNMGNLGYLCEVTRENILDAIDGLLTDQHAIEERMMLSGCISGWEAPKSALNDIVIHRAGEATMLSILVYVNGELLTTYQADGIIVATPTGSTGYSMSAGGPIVEPKSNMILLTPVNAHNLNSKSIVLSAEDEIILELTKRREDVEELADVTFDGERVAMIGVGERCVISRGNNVTKICKLSNKSFLELLSKKMQFYV